MRNILFSTMSTTMSFNGSPMGGSSGNFSSFPRSACGNEAITSSTTPLRARASRKCDTSPTLSSGSNSIAITLMSATRNKLSEFYVLIRHSPHEAVDATPNAQYVFTFGAITALQHAAFDFPAAPAALIGLSSSFRLCPLSLREALSSRIIIQSWHSSRMTSWPTNSSARHLCPRESARNQQLFTLNHAQRRDEFHSIINAASEKCIAVSLSITEITNANPVLRPRFKRRNLASTFSRRKIPGNTNCAAARCSAMNRPFQTMPSAFMHARIVRA